MENSINRKLSLYDTLKLIGDLGITIRYFAVEYIASIKGHEKKFGQGFGETTVEAAADLISRIVLMLNLPQNGNFPSNLVEAVRELKEDE